MTSVVSCLREKQQVVKVGLKRPSLLHCFKLRLTKVSPFGLQYNIFDFTFILYRKLIIAAIQSLHRTRSSGSFQK